jgi:hypothetical protein
MADEVRSIDLTPTSAPALSSTSDMPKAGVKLPAPKGAVSEEELKSGGTEAVKAAAKKLDKGDDKDKGADAAVGKPDPKPEDKGGAAAADADKGADKDAAKDPDKPDGKGDETPAWQKRQITQARNRQRAAEERADRLEAQVTQLVASVEKLTARTGQEIKTDPAEDPRPDRAKFDDPEKYDAALVAWSAKTASKLTLAEHERQQAQRAAADKKRETEAKQQADLKALDDAWIAAKAKAIEKNPDWEEIAEAQGVEITPAMAFVMKELNQDEPGTGLDVAYYFGSSEAGKAEALRISKLTTFAKQSAAIGRLAERLAKPEPAKVTKVPDPVKPLGARAAAVKKSPSDESMEEYAARRNAEIRATPH